MNDFRMYDGISECQASYTIISTSSGGNVVMVKEQDKECEMSEPGRHFHC